MIATLGELLRKQNVDRFEKSDLWMTEIGRQCITVLAQDSVYAIVDLISVLSVLSVISRVRSLDLKCAFVWWVGKNKIEI